MPFTLKLMANATFYLALLWQYLTMHIVTKATPINDINNKKTESSRISLKVVGLFD